MASSSLDEKTAFFAQFDAATASDEDTHIDDEHREASRRILRGPKRRRIETEKPQAQTPQHHAHAKKAANPARQHVIEGTPINALAQNKRLRAALQRSESFVRETPPATRKRKPEKENTRPEAEQVLRGLSLFYVPDNDVSPVRRLRIAKAREYGAQWVRDVQAATHVVVEKGIPYKDVEALLRPGVKAVVVNEEYPLQCIQLRTLLDAAQRKYRVPGQPSLDKEVREEPGIVEEDQSLELKAPQRNPKRWDYVPVMTPESAGESVVEETQGGDELAEYISLLQGVKDLPLDEDDDGRSAIDDEESQEEASEDDRARSTRRTTKEIAPRDRFACNRGGKLSQASTNPNGRTIEVLEKMASYYDRINDHWRSIGYRKAISTLRSQTLKIATEEDAIRLPSIGRRLAQKIEEIVSTDRLRRLDYATSDPMDTVLQLFTGIYGVGSSQAQRWMKQGYRTLDDLREKAKLSPNQRMGVEHYDDLAQRIPRDEVEALGVVVNNEARDIDPDVELIIGGSYRRGAPSSGDIDIVVTKPGTATAGELRPFLRELVRRLEAKAFLVAAVAAGEGSTWHGCCVLPGGAGIWRRIDFLLVPPAELGAALLYFTGNDIFNRSMRLLARKRGMKLNQRGLYAGGGPSAGGGVLVSDGALVEARCERRVFEVLDVEWREPSERWC